MTDVEVIDDPAAATVALDPIRSRLLAEFAEPASAATLAERLGIACQKVNYHLRTGGVDCLVPLVSPSKEQSLRGVAGPEWNVRALSAEVSHTLPFVTCGACGKRTRARSWSSSHPDSDVIHGINVLRRNWTQRLALRLAED